jgi:hypothetical protein
VERRFTNDDCGLSILWTDTFVMLQVRTRRQKEKKLKRSLCLSRLVKAVSRGELELGEFLCAQPIAEGLARSSVEASPNSYDVFFCFKGSSLWLRGVGVVVQVVCFHGNALFFVGSVL